MIHEKIDVRVEGSEDYAALYTYVHDYSPNIGISKRPMVIICPGGAYARTSDREAESIALTFNAMGAHAAVLRYSTAPAYFPTSLRELAKAVSIIREHAEEWHIDADKIIIQGSSAGGHLVASLGCFWNSDFMKKEYDAEMIRPNGLILCYPVITTGEFTHQNSVTNISGPLTDAKAFGSDESIADFLSLENRVTEDTPPCFIWATFEDGAVPVENTLMFATALRKSNINTELHIFPHGGHGLSLANGITTGATGKENVPAVTAWVPLVRTWLEENYPMTFVY